MQLHGVDAETGEIGRKKLARAKLSAHFAQLRPVRIARELHRDVATGAQARAIYRIGEHYRSADETLARLGWAPNRQPGERGAPLRRAA